MKMTSQLSGTNAAGNNIFKFPKITCISLAQDELPVVNCESNIHNFIAFYRSLFLQFTDKFRTDEVTIYDTYEKY